MTEDIKSSKNIEDTSETKITILRNNIPMQY